VCTSGVCVIESFDDEQKVPHEWMTTEMNKLSEESTEGSLCMCMCVDSLISFTPNSPSSNEAYGSSNIIMCLHCLSPLPYSFPRSSALLCFIDWLLRDFFLYIECPLKNVSLGSVCWNSKHIFVGLTFLVTVPVENVDGVLGQRGRLPCDVGPPSRDDKLHMVLWFRDRDSEPIYR